MNKKRQSGKCCDVSKQGEGQGRRGRHSCLGVGDLSCLLETQFLFKREGNIHTGHGGMSGICFTRINCESISKIRLARVDNY